MTHRMPGAEHIDSGSNLGVKLRSWNAERLCIPVHRYKLYLAPKGTVAPYRKGHRVADRRTKALSLYDNVQTWWMATKKNKYSVILWAVHFVLYVINSPSYHNGLSSHMLCLFTWECIA